MCTTRLWKDIESSISSNNSVQLIARRSDGLVVQLSAIFLKEDTEIRACRKVAKLMKDLETFRNCKCTPTHRCFEHTN